jgi:hypothetical protein
VVSFITIIQKFGKQGEKTGWTYIEIPHEMADLINPGVKKSYRVKGKLDKYPIKGVAVLPMGDGSFIMALNAEMRKGIRKQKGDQLQVKLELDREEPKQSSDLLQVLADEPEALNKFKSLPRGHQNYFSKWIDSAKTDTTKARRIVYAIRFLAAGNTFSEMLRTIKKEKEQGLTDW